MGREIKSWAGKISFWLFIAYSCLWMLFYFLYEISGRYPEPYSYTYDLLSTIPKETLRSVHAMISIIGGVLLVYFTIRAFIFISSISRGAYRAFSALKLRFFEGITDDKTDSFLPNYSEFISFSPLCCVVIMGSKMKSCYSISPLK